MANTNPYSRVYWSVIDDARFEGIYTDDRHFSTWVRLLMIADGAFPAPASVPRAARTASVRALADRGIIDLLPGGLFRVHGMNGERERRAEHSGGLVRAATAIRGAGGRFLPAVVTSGGDQRVQLSETRQDETRRDKQATAGNHGESLRGEHEYGKHKVVKDLDCPLCFYQEPAS